MSEYPIPVWVRAFSDTCIEAFGLGEWQIKLRMVDRVEHPSGAEAWGHVIWDEGDYGRYEALVSLDRTLAEGEHGYYIIAHELLHLSLSDYYYPAASYLNEEAMSWWWSVNEEVVERKARALVPSLVLSLRQKGERNEQPEFFGRVSMREMPIEERAV